MPHSYDNIGLFSSGIIFCISILRLAALVMPNPVYMILGLPQTKQETQTNDQSEEEEPEKRLVPQPDQPWSILNMQDFHDALSIRFARHQELLIEGNIKKALSTLEFFRQQLSIHITEENEIIIENYKMNCPLPEKEKQLMVQMYLGEHKKFLGLLQEVTDRLREMQMCFVTNKSADILYILELEFRFKGMLGRHDSREVRDLYVGAEYGLSEEERKSIWDECFLRRQELGFRLGNEETLTDLKIRSVQRNWMTYKDRFPETISKVAEELEATLPLSEFVGTHVQGTEPGLAEAHFVENVVQHLDKLDKTSVRELRSELPPNFQIEDCDEFGSLILRTLERIQDGPFNPAMREYWANALNVVFTSNREDVF